MFPNDPDPYEGEIVPADTGREIATPVPDAWFQYTEDWLENRRLSPNTRAAYRNDLNKWWLPYCARTGLDPAKVKFTDLNAFARWMERGDPDADPPRKPATAKTVARRLSAVSRWYEFLVMLEYLPRNPVDACERPRVDPNYTATVSFTQQQSAAMRGVAEHGDRTLDALTARALTDLLVVLGVRASEVCALDVSDLGHNGKHRTVTLTVKGGKRQTRSVAPGLGHSLDTMLAARAAEAGCVVEDLEGPLLVTRQGKRLDRFQVYRFVQRVARDAGLPNWRNITPHSYRHAWNCTARERGAPLEDRQDAMGHADPRTTRRYDRNASSLDRDPAYLVDVATAPLAPGAGGGQ